MFSKIIKTVSKAFVISGFSLVFSLPSTAETSSIRNHQAILHVDYQDIKLNGGGDFDLAGYHLLTPVNDWLHLGFGSYAPVRKGAFGGFMAFGFKAHAQTHITERLFLNSGLAFGGGGGGKGIAQSVELSGTGGYVKGYFGLGYQFDKFALGANVSHMRFVNSNIDSTQLNVFFQRRFGHATSPYRRAGQEISAHDAQQIDFALGKTSDSFVSFGLDNYKQIDPTGSRKGVIGAADIQYSKFMTKNTYWYYALGVGYKELPLYNQVIAGLGKRFTISPRVNLYAQMGLGSGGYAPALIDTGSGLLAYPKIGAEYRFNNNLGLMLTAGYLLAPDGTSKNMTFGAALNYHIQRVPHANSHAQKSGKFQGIRFSMAHETEVDVTYNNTAQSNLQMLSIQGDFLVNDHLYFPIRGAISYVPYRGYPGYGELSLGIGVNTKYNPDKKTQLFGELHAGANVQGALIRAVAGVQYEINENLALRGFIGKTKGQDGFGGTNFGFGVTSRFSIGRF